MVFESLLQVKSLKRWPIIVVLSKPDLLREEIKTQPLVKSAWPDYADDCDNAEEVISFVSEKFYDAARKEDRNLEIVVADLTDPESSKPVLDLILART